VPLFLSEFNETWIFSTDFRKVRKYRFPLKSSQWAPSCSRRTDGHYEANSFFPQFWERASDKCLQAGRHCPRNTHCCVVTIHLCSGFCNLAGQKGIRRCIWPDRAAVRMW
jgi:hypothetical protein